jgi:WD40 repeat protein
LVTIQKDHQPGWFDMGTGKPLPQTWTTLNAPCDRGLTVSADGELVAIVGWRSCLVVDVKSGSVDHKFNNLLSQASFHPDGTWVLANWWGTAARLLPVRGDGRTPLAIPQMHLVTFGAFSSDGSVAAVSGGKLVVVVWQLPRQEAVVGNISSWETRPRRPRLSFDGRLVTPGVWHETPHGIVPFKQTLTVANVSDGQPAGPAISLGSDLVDSCLCADNRTVAAVCSTGNAGNLSVYDVASGQRLFAPVLLPSAPLSVSARPGRPQVAILCARGELITVDLTNGAQILRLTHEGWTRDDRWPDRRVAYSPDGKLLVTATSDRRVFVRFAETGEMRFPTLNPVLEGGALRSIALSEDSRFLATAVNGKNAVEV